MFWRLSLKWQQINPWYHQRGSRAIQRAQGAAVISCSKRKLRAFTPYCITSQIGQSDGNMPGVDLMIHNDRQRSLLKHHIHEMDDYAWIVQYSNLNHEMNMPWKYTNTTLDVWNQFIFSMLNRDQRVWILCRINNLFLINIISS